MKIIFTDIDGVCNASFTKIFLVPTGTIFVMDSKLELLKQLVDRTGAKLVLSSTWRHGFYDLQNGINSVDASDYIALRDKFAEFGLEFIGHTPITNGGMNRRGEEIDMWLKSWDGEPIESLVVLDDLNGCYLRPYSGRLVRTSFSKGLMQKHVDLAVKILNKPLAGEIKEAPAEPATLVNYSWSEDGEVELCEKMEDILQEDKACDYCDQKMKAGEKAVFLFSIDDGAEYALHPECAKKSCNPA